MKRRAARARIRQRCMTRSHCDSFNGMSFSPVPFSIRPTTLIHLMEFDCCYNTDPALKNFVFFLNGKENIKQTFIIALSLLETLQVLQIHETDKKKTSVALVR
jgi:hypothetical protein